MAYTIKGNVVAVAVMILVVAIAPQWTDAEPMPEMDKWCAIWIPEIVNHCYATMNVKASEECCKDLKTASKREVTCLCDNFFAHPNPVYSNITKVYFTQVNTDCGVVDKYTCNGTANGGASNKIAASISLFGLVATLFV